MSREPCDLFRDERGFTTIAVAVSLLLTLALVFSAAQVYRINSLSSEVQSVADAAALAALDEVAEFMIVVRVCDAVVLSLTLTSVVATALGVVALCIPVASSVADALLSAGKSMAAARDEFAEAAASGLNVLQRALPFLAAVNAAAVAAANNGDSSSYVALALLAPSESEDIVVGSAAGVTEALATVDDEASDIQDASSVAEEAQEAAEEAKQLAYEHDCGANPSYCMYERASTLAGLSAAENPLYTSVDAWSFSVALERAQAYYAARLANEEPEDDSVEEQARSALRKRFYAYAVEQLASGYVHETSTSFEAYFPELPQNTAEMRETTLYTEEVYPVTTDADGNSVMHAWDGCPAIEGTTTLGSIEQMEEGSYATCSVCGFTAASLGKVAAASSSIENGFEYHYAIVAAAAEDYEAARAVVDPLTSSAKSLAEQLLDQLAEALGLAADMRIEATPPGSYGVVVIVANVGSTAASSGFASAFVQATGSLGTRVAISAATLVEDPSGEGGSVLSSLLDGLADEAGAASGVMGVVLDCWSGLLSAYATGQSALIDTVEDALNAIPLIGVSGLGSWAANALSDMVEQVGLQPADLDALKPVLVNSAHVAAAGDDAFFAALVSLKSQVIANPSVADGGLGTLLGSIATTAIEEVTSTTFEVATLELYDGGPSFTIELALPSVVTSAATSLIDRAASALDDLVTQVTGVTIWQ